MTHHIYDRAVHIDMPGEWEDHQLDSLTAHWLDTWADTWYKT